MTARADVPLTVLGGYLGSGKTTLVNAMLRGAAGRRVAVLVNDFGAVNVDADLIRRRGATTLELSNGCVCCNLVDGMAQARITLAGLDPRPEYAVVELSGVAKAFIRPVPPTTSIQTSAVTPTRLCRSSQARRPEPPVRTAPKSSLRMKGA